MYYKINYSLQKQSHDPTFTLCLFRLRLTFLPNRIDRICHHDYFFQFFHFPLGLRKVSWSCLTREAMSVLFIV